MDSAPAAPEGPFHHLLFIQPGPSRALVTLWWPQPDPGRPWPLAAAREALSSAGIFSSAHDIARVHGVTYFGKAELSPLWVPTCWEDAASPRNSPPRAPCPQHVVLGSPWMAQNPGQILGGRRRVLWEPGLSAAGACAGLPGGCCSAGTQQPFGWALHFHTSLASDKISSSQIGTGTAWIWVPKGVILNNSAFQWAKLCSQPSWALWSPQIDSGDHKITD